MMMIMKAAALISLTLLAVAEGKKTGIRGTLDALEHVSGDGIIWGGWEHLLGTDDPLSAANVEKNKIMREWKKKNSDRMKEADEWDDARIEKESQRRTAAVLELCPTAQKYIHTYIPQNEVAYGFDPSKECPRMQGYFDCKDKCAKEAGQQCGRASVKGHTAYTDKYILGHYLSNAKMNLGCNQRDYGMDIASFAAKWVPYMGCVANCEPNEEIACNTFMHLRNNDIRTKLGRPDLPMLVDAGLGKPVDPPAGLSDCDAWVAYQRCGSTAANAVCSDTAQAAVDPAPGVLMTAPKAVAKASSDIILDNDTVGLFLAKHSQVSEVGWPKDDCYRRYLSYCDDHGKTAIEDRKFTSTMVAKKYLWSRKKFDGERLPFWKGIEWKEE